MIQYNIIQPIYTNCITFDNFLWNNNKDTNWVKITFYSGVLSRRIFYCCNTCQSARRLKVGLRKLHDAYEHNILDVNGKLRLQGELSKIFKLLKIQGLVTF